MDKLRFLRNSCALAVILLVNVIPYVLYKNVKNNKPPAIHRRISNVVIRNRRLKNVSNLHNGIPPLHHVQMHFYNPPRWGFKGCHKKCSISVGKDLAYYNKDVVIFYGPTLGELPVKKRRGQIWVLYGSEAPPNHHHISRWNGLFNWTMTYRRDSDFLFMFGGFRNGLQPSVHLPNIRRKQINHVIDSTKFKSIGNVQPTAWFVTNCQAQSRREDYVRTLNKTHHVDIYGPCGNLQCDKSQQLQCLSMLSQKYKFYLSFENSLCRDYITEKSFKIYKNSFDTVPITRGFGEMYSLYLPPGSYIDTNNYTDIDQLGQFLNYLGKNKTLYLQYFKWRKYYKVQSYCPLCKLCDRMHKPDMTTRYYRVYNDIHRWFFGSPNVTICTNATDLRN